ncbi:MAG: pyridoxal 5'-phosphate synthase glutaminase subunit PdxT [Patescibacteria group bacterium]|nr:pyridoxal 5'-phosphate synthase glutaminase subunit PdxT [Patescibacteria group bacterium]
MKIGVLAIQGSVKEHKAALAACGAEVLEVRVPDDLTRVAALVIPGGESTTIRKLMKLTGLDKALADRIRGGMPVYGTCAGAILLEDFMDIEVERNAYGRQMDSFEAEIKIFKGKSFNAIFIRAPKILKTSKGVEILAKYGKEVIMCRQGNILVSSFHPELTSDLRVHKYFLKMIDGQVPSEKC